MTQPLVVWTEIPVRDVARAAAFFDAVLGTTTTVDSSGPQPMANIGDAMDGVGCSLFEGDPAAATIVHFNVPELASATARATAAGGTVDGAPVEIPPGRFAYVTDPDGNRIGLFEPKAA
ncbi:MAG: VOC family protein [Paracoccaceae bacterium]